MNGKNKINNTSVQVSANFIYNEITTETEFLNQNESDNIINKKYNDTIFLDVLATNKIESINIICGLTLNDNSVTYSNLILNTGFTNSTEFSNNFTLLQNCIDKKYIFTIYGEAFNNSDNTFIISAAYFNTINTNQIAISKTYNYEFNYTFRYFVISIDRIYKNPRKFKYSSK